LLDFGVEKKKGVRERRGKGKDVERKEEKGMEVRVSE